MPRSKAQDFTFDISDLEVEEIVLPPRRGRVRRSAISPTDEMARASENLAAAGETEAEAEEITGETTAPLEKSDDFEALDEILSESAASDLTEEAVVESEPELAEADAQVDLPDTAAVEETPAESEVAEEPANVAEALDVEEPDEVPTEALATEDEADLSEPILEEAPEIVDEEAATDSTEAVEDLMKEESSSGEIPAAEEVDSPVEDLAPTAEPVAERTDETEVERAEPESAAELADSVFEEGSESESIIEEDPAADDDDLETEGLVEAPVEALEPESELDIPEPVLEPESELDIPEPVPEPASVEAVSEEPVAEAVDAEEPDAEEADEFKEEVSGLLDAFDEDLDAEGGEQDQAEEPEAATDVDALDGALDQFKNFVVPADSELKAEGEDSSEDSGSDESESVVSAEPIAAEPELEPEPEAKSEPDLETEPVAEAESEPAAEPEAEAEAELKVEAESEPDAELEPERELEPEPQIETDEGEAVASDDSPDPEIPESASESSEPEAAEPEVISDLDAPAPEGEESEPEPATEDKVTSAEDLLMQAGSVLNGGPSPIPDEVEEAAVSAETEKPEGEEPAVLDDEDEDEDDFDDEGLMAMPDPQAMMAEAAEATETAEAEEPEAEEDDDDDDDLDGIMAMPDPVAMMSEAAESAAEPEPESESEPDAEPEESKSGSVADRAGDLPPPPPSPVSLDEDDSGEAQEAEGAVAEESPPAEAKEEDAAVAESESAAVPAVDDSDDEIEAEPEAAKAGEGLEAFSGDDSLDGFNADPDEAPAEETAEESADAAMEQLMSEVAKDEVPSEKSEVAVEGEKEASKPGLIKRIAYSATWATAFVLAGLAAVAATMKQEIIEWSAGKDLDASSLTREIKFVTGHVLEGLNEDGLYRMRNLDTKVKRISDDEIRLHAKVSAQLNRNLYVPVSEHEAIGELPFKESELEASKAYAHEHAPDLLSLYPEKDWGSLYKLSVPRLKVVPLNVTYRLEKDVETSDWGLAEIFTRSEVDEEVEWPEGQPLETFGDKSYDAGSLDFEEKLESYKQMAVDFIKKIEGVKDSKLHAKAKHAEAMERNRKELAASLSAGTYFKGMAITGVEGDRTLGVTMIITETRENGSIFKGVFKLPDEEEASKHFTGFLDFSEEEDGSLKGILNVTTVSFEGQKAEQVLPKFFNPGTISRIEMETDGIKLEGDSHGVSLRLLRDS